MKFIIQLFLCLISFASIANKYYFSASIGDDTRSLIEAKDPNTPLRSINKLNNSLFQTGDSILFKCGDTFYGNIIIQKNNMYFGSYGDGDKPIITGFSKITSWSQIGRGIYESQMQNNSMINALLIDTVMQYLGRYPNKQDDNSGYLTFQSHVGQISISSSQISNILDFVGGEVVIRPQRDILDVCLITGQSNTTVTYKKVSAYIPINGYGFFFQNHINALDEFGEWCYNISSKKLDVYFADDAPQFHSISASTVDELISAQSRNNITVYNIKFTGANTRAIYFLGGSNIKIRNCDFFYMGQDAINTQASTNVTIDSCHIRYCNNSGITQAKRDTYSGSVISNCLVEQIGINPGMGGSGSSSYQGIYVQGHNNKVINNVVDTIGYSGIKFLFGDSNLIKNNHVNYFCFVKNDGGGIYTWNNLRGENREVIAKTYFGNKVTGNIIQNAGKCNDGTLYSTVSTDVTGSHGIYCDGNSENVTVSYNTIIDCDKGLFLHDNRNMNVIGNTFFNNRESQIDAYYDDITLKPVRNLVIKNNIIYSVTKSQIQFRYRTDVNDVALIGSFDSNYYGNPVSGLNLIVARWKKNGLAFSQNYSLRTWQIAYNRDFNSKNVSTYMPEFKIDSLIGNDLYANGTYEANIEGTSCFNKDGICNSTWINGKLDNGCYQLSYDNRTTTTTSTNVIINVGTVNTGKNYILHYSLKGTKNNGTVAVYLRSKTTYKNLVTKSFRTFGIFRLDDDILLVPTFSDNTTQIIFGFSNRDSSIYLDNVSLKEAALSISDPYDFAHIEVNASGNSKNVILSKQYIGVDDKLYSGTINLQPYSSLILLNKQ